MATYRIVPYIVVSSIMTYGLMMARRKEPKHVVNSKHYTL